LQGKGFIGQAMDLDIRWGMDMDIGWRMDLDIAWGIRYVAVVRPEILVTICT